MLTKTKDAMLKAAGINNPVLAEIIKPTQLELAFIGELPTINVEKLISSEIFLKRLNTKNAKAINIRECNLEYRWVNQQIYINCRYDLVNNEGAVTYENKYDWQEFNLEEVEDMLIWPSDSKVNCI